MAKRWRRTKSLRIRRSVAHGRLYRWRLRPVHHGLYQVLWITAEVRPACVWTAAPVRRGGPAAVLVPPGIAHGFRFAHGTRGWVPDLCRRAFSPMRISEHSAGSAHRVRRAARCCRLPPRENTALAIWRPLFAQVDGRSRPPRQRRCQWRPGSPGPCSGASPHVAPVRNPGGGSGRTSPGPVHAFRRAGRAHFLEHWPVSLCLTTGHVGVAPEPPGALRHRRHGDRDFRTAPDPRSDACCSSRRRCRGRRQGK